MKTYWNTTDRLKVIPEWQPNCWIQVTCPTNEDQNELEERFNIPDYFFPDISDTDERARYEYDDGWMLIILRIPYVKEIRSRTPYTTVPLGIIHKRDVTITVCYFETNMMIDFVSYQQKRGVGFTDYVDMIFRLFLSSAVWYLKRLKQINTLIETAKHNLDHEVNNESLIGLSRLQDSLTYSSIINNNMNTVMRTLTSVSIIMMVPTLISSFLGMNLLNSMEQSPWGFPLALIISFIITAISWWLLKRKRLI